jgi:cellulase/cellobiase CelA1
LWQRLTAAGYKVDFVGSLSNGPASLGDHDHEGHSGWRIDQIDANIVGWLNTFQPHTVLLHIGTNDIGQNFDVPNAPARLSTLIDHITTTAPSAEVFVAQLVPLSFNDSAVRTFNGAIPGIVQSKVNAGKHVHMVDMHSAVSTADLADGVHPNAAGYDKMATVWNSALLSVPGSVGNPGGVSPSPSRTTVSPTPSRTGVPPSTPPADRGCTATYAVTGQWQGGFQASVTVTAGSSPIGGWSVTWQYANGQTVTQVWSATVTAAGANVTARNVGYNGALGAGASTEFGFLGTWNGANAAPTPIACAAT